MPYTWQSRTEETAGYGYFGTARVWGEGSVEMTLYASGRQVTTRTLLPSEAVRLPRYGHHITHAIKFHGTQLIYGLEMATTRWDLARTL